MNSSQKDDLHSHCLHILEEKLTNIGNEMKLIQNSANSDTKSSMGDKYETSRAMAMLEKENMASQLKVVQDQIKVLREINITKRSEKIELGSLVIMDNGNKYYISVSMGKMEWQNDSYLLISPVSPAGLSMLGQKVGARITLAKSNMLISEII